MTTTYQEESYEELAPVREESLHVAHVSLQNLLNDDVKQKFSIAIRFYSDKSGIGQTTKKR